MVRRRNRKKPLATFKDRLASFAHDARETASRLSADLLEDQDDWSDK